MKTSVGMFGSVTSPPKSAQCGKSRPFLSRIRLQNFMLAIICSFVNLTTISLESSCVGTYCSRTFVLALPANLERRDRNETNHLAKATPTQEVMKHLMLRTVVGFLFALVLGACPSLLGQTSPFVGQDVGTPTHPGGFTNNVDGTISINGGGDDIWNTGDNFFYYYTSVTGLVWEAKMRVVSFTGPDYWSKIELMARRPDPVGGTPQGPAPGLKL